MNTAVRRLTEHAARKRSAGFGSTRPGRRLWQTQLLGDYPLEIVPVDDHEEPCESKSIAPLTGSLRQISSQGVSFEHDEPFAARIVLLTFKLGDDQRVSFVVDVMWSQKTVDGFTSGGTVLAVGVPAAPDAGADAELTPAESAP